MTDKASSYPKQVAVLDRKRLNEMNRLGDMGRFPIPVLCGATFNVLLTIGVVWHFEPRCERTLYPLVYWIAGVLALNLLPVVLLRLTLKPATVYPLIEEMDFFRDQHKFSNWVYLAASANMAFWISAAWIASDLCHRHIIIAPLMIIAFLATFFPAWVRIFKR
jgi:hypothetical protein